MDSSLASLLELAAALAGKTLQETEQLAAAMQLSSRSAPWSSTLNNDGSPLQLSISLGGGTRAAVRLLVDPAADYVSGDERIHRVEQALGAVLDSHAPDMQVLCNSILANMLPTQASVRAALPSGGAWLAASLSGQGMALYVSTKWGNGDSRWACARQWLAALLPDAGVDSDTILDRLSAHTLLVSAGVEGVSSKRARAKLYWRLNGGASLKSLGIPLLDTSEIANFLNIVIEDRQISRAAIVGSVSFNLDSGSLSDVKLDVCGHCVPRSWTEWMPILQRCVTRFEFAEWPFELQGLWQKSEVAFIGLGLDQARVSRLNVYLKRVSQ